jgi:hypothetical protein
VVNGIESGVIRDLLSTEQPFCKFPINFVQISQFSAYLIALKMSTKRSRVRAARAEGEKAEGASNKEKMWDNLPWHSVDVTKENLGDYEDTVFFGLEELDGNAYTLNKTQQVTFRHTCLCKFRCVFVCYAKNVIVELSSTCNE